MNSPQENQDSPLYSSPESSFREWGVILPFFEEHAIIFARTVIPKMGCGILYISNGSILKFQKVCITFENDFDFPVEILPRMFNKFFILFRRV